jgi:hypothetical protein
MYAAMLRNATPTHDENKPYYSKLGAAGDILFYS